MKVNARKTRIICKQMFNRTKALEDPRYFIAIDLHAPVLDYRSYLDESRPWTDTSPCQTRRRSSIHVLPLSLVTLLLILFIIKFTVYENQDYTFHFYLLTRFEK